MATLTQEEARALQPGERIAALTFEELDLRRHDFADSELADCVFVGCNLADARFNSAVMKNCRFENCSWQGTDLFGVAVSGCKMMAADFTRGTRIVAATFVDTNVDYSLFRGVDLRRIEFRDCAVREADFTGADLSSASFLNCDLDGADLSAATTRNTDLRGSKLGGFDLRHGPYGVIVDGGQALVLVEALGLSVLDVRT